MMIQFPSNLINDLGVKPIIDLRGVIPVNPHYSWEQLCGLRRPDALTTIVVHHDALPKWKYTGVSDFELAARIAKGHINSTVNHAKGDPGFPYDIWIRNGQAYLCNDILAFKYGVANNNGYTVHVSVSGDYKYSDALTDADRNTLIAVILMLQNMEELPNLKIIKGHGEITPTSCPGFDMNRLRNDVTTTKHLLESAKTIESRRGKAYDVMNQTQFMYTLIGRGDGDEEWALNYFEKFYSLMKDEGWFK